METFRLIAVFRVRSGQVFATQPTCPRRGGVVADSVIGGTQLLCPLHGFKFDLASGRPLGNGCSALKTYEVEVSDRGEIKLCLEER
jgi:nitrite reductase (NADH) small subunit